MRFNQQEIHSRHMSTRCFEKVTFHETAPNLESGAGQVYSLYKTIVRAASGSAGDFLQRSAGGGRGQIYIRYSFFSGMASDLRALGRLDAETHQLRLNHAINEIRRHADTVLGEIICGEVDGIRLFLLGQVQARF